MSELEELLKEEMTKKSAPKRTAQAPASTKGGSGDIDKVFGNVFGASQASDSKPTTSEDVENAMEPAAVPAPKPKSKRKGKPVDPAHTPTPEEVLDPERPSLEGASHHDVVDSINDIVNDIYTTVLYETLEELKATLAKVPPPEEPSFALALMGWVVETITSWTIGSIGKLASTSIKQRSQAAKHEGTISAATEGKAAYEELAGEGMVFTPIASAAKDRSKEATAEGNDASADASSDLIGAIGAGAGGALSKHAVKPRPTTVPQKVPSRAMPGEPLHVEFIARQKSKLLEKKNDIKTTLRLIRSSAAGKARRDLVELDDALRTLIGSADLRGWFRQKVVMEWMNFIARISLGPRAKDQGTDMPGANKIDGIAAAGPKARQQWTGADGFVEIRFTTPDVINGLKGVELQRATIPSSYGAMQTLRESGDSTDANGGAFTLATLPVYRRIWLQTGSSMLSEAPAFVITPDGNIECDVSNPVLAAIGSGGRVDVGEVVHGVGGSRLSEEERKDEGAWMRRTVGASQCLVGAHLIREKLRGISPGSLQ